MRAPEVSDEIPDAPGTSTTKGVIEVEQEGARRALPLQVYIPLAHHGHPGTPQQSRSSTRVPPGPAVKGPRDARRLQKDVQGGCGGERFRSGQALERMSKGECVLGGWGDAGVAGTRSTMARASIRSGVQ